VGGNPELRESRSGGRLMTFIQIKDFASRSGFLALNVAIATSVTGSM
jgi:hypothetical protein